MWAVNTAPPPQPQAADEAEAKRRGITLAAWRRMRIAAEEIEKAGPQSSPAWDDAGKVLFALFGLFAMLTFTVALVSSCERERREQAALAEEQAREEAARLAEEKRKVEEEARRQAAAEAARVAEEKRKAEEVARAVEQWAEQWRQEQEEALQLQAAIDALTPKCNTPYIDDNRTCWLKAANRENCYVWDRYMVGRNKRATWSGQCTNGKAGGQGELFLTWEEDGKTESMSMEGTLVDDVRKGHWVSRFASGTVAEGSFVDDKQHGDWVIRGADGTVAEGPFVDGKQHGHWVARLADGGVQEGPYVDGKRHGHWVLRFADGQVEEGPYVDGKQHGTWIVRPRFGAAYTVQFINGVQQ